MRYISFVLFSICARAYCVCVCVRACAHTLIDMSNREADIEMNNTNKIGNNDATTPVELLQGYDGSDDALCGTKIAL